MCLYPKLIKNKKYTANKKNGGIVPPVFDERVLLVPVGCGKCIECMKQKKREWQVRLSEELRHDRSGKFVTLTFTNESLIELEKDVGIRDLGKIIENEIATLAVRRFLERWRKSEKKSVKHWLITELGHNGTENIHLHGIIWTDKKEEFVRNKWKYGFIWTNEKKGVVSPKVVSYITKYVTKIDEKHQEYKPIILTSPGIGKNYINHKKRDFYKTESGHKLGLPIYYKNKTFTEEEREQNWLKLLDKEERWVDGVKVDVSKNLDDYYKVLETAREKNKRLGYRDNTIDWERRTYERELRNMNYKKRTKKT